MSEKLTTEQLADVHGRVNDGRCHLCQNGPTRRGCPACDGTGAFSLGTDAMMSIIAELRERRAADLSAEDMRTLRVLRDDTAEYGILAPDQQWRSRDEEQDADAGWTRRALAVLDRLLDGGE